MSVAEGRLRVAVAVCDHLAAPQDRSELAALCESLQDELPDVRAAVVPDLSRKAERGPRFAAGAGADRLVLGVCSESASIHDVQRHMRRAGLDPFAVEVLCLPEGSVTRGTSARAALRLVAAVARLRVFAGTEPEQLRPRLLVEGTAVSRRSLLTLPPLIYEAVPSVAEERCPEPERCRLCVQVCPRDALGTEAGRVVVDKARCDGCGLCVGACPRRAVVLPGSSLPQYEAQIEALLAAPAPGLLFCCRRAAAAREEVPTGWLPVEVPCIGSATPGWTLQALAAGASAIGFSPCAHECGFSVARAEERVSYLRDLLRLLGDERAAERVQLAKFGHEPGPPPCLPPLRPAGRPAGSLRLSEPAATAGGLLELSRGGTSRTASPRPHAASPLGLVHLHEDACTACGACAAVCPTGALRLEESAERIALSYDATACVGCGRCELACPEGSAAALWVERTTDLDALARGRTVLVAETLVRCRSCGNPIAPRRLLGRIRELLAGEEQGEQLLRILGERCTHCRGSALAGAKTTRYARNHRPAGAIPHPASRRRPGARVAAEPEDAAKGDT